MVMAKPLLYSQQIIVTSHRCIQTYVWFEVPTIWSADRQIERFGVLPVKVNDLKCRPSISTIWRADRQIRRFGVQTVQFNDLEC